jgi:hypothetical protein
MTMILFIQLVGRNNKLLEEKRKEWCSLHHRTGEAVKRQRPLDVEYEYINIILKMSLRVQLSDFPQFAELINIFTQFCQTFRTEGFFFFPFVDN